VPYEGEFAGYRALQRIAECERVLKLLQRAEVHSAQEGAASLTPRKAPTSSGDLPRYVLAVDGSHAEVDVRVGYPGAKVGYCTVASVLLDMTLINDLDVIRPFDPEKFRETEKAAAVDAAFPGSNVVTRRQKSARASFREELYDHLHDAVIDEDEKVPLIQTYEALLSKKPKAHQQKCPYFEDDGCDQLLTIPPGVTKCPKCKRPVFSTDALRIHERFADLGTNGEAFGLVMQVWERLIIVHLLRCFEKRGLLDKMNQLAFFLDGPLAVFGPPAWLSAAISAELKRINSVVTSKTGHDLVIVGIETTGEFVTHYQEMDQTETSGQTRFEPQTYMLLTDHYIKERIQRSASSKRFGEDTYFGRKFFYKTKSGAKIVASIPFLSEVQDTIETDEVDIYPEFGTICALLDHLASSRFPNAVTPIILAHAYAAIPLSLGAKVLTQIARALMGERRP
jgi:hypothetical protein